jgi:N-methylhydantoinase A/oxoprolinase/acetone carboxylase beta subunit
LIDTPEHHGEVDMADSPRFRIGVDIGGTFTDCVVAERGNRTVAKAMTTHGSLTDGVLDALRVNAEQLGLTRSELLSATDMFVHGTTVATNAILTRAGARTGLITTRGHEDTLIMGKSFSKAAGLSERERAHAARLRKPEPIIPRELIRGVTERVDVDGQVIVPLQDEELVGAVRELLAEGVEAIAVSFLWSFANDAHERRAEELMANLGVDVFTTFSCELAPVLGEYERTATTALNAYIGPKMIGYLQSLESELQREGLASRMLVMQSSGGLTSVEDASIRPIMTLDSGPTGGVLGCLRLGELYDEPNVICTDVGGTSFDVGLIIGGEVTLDSQPIISQHVLNFPKVSVKSIGAGGGSIAWVDDFGLLRVGPQSAGSAPGPACYGRGGREPTVTDADLVLGYVDPDAFLGGRMRLDRELAMRALAGLGRRLGLEPEEVAMGIFRIINSHMADLIRTSTIERGHDPRDCILVAYGGAAPAHAVFYGDDINAKGIYVLADSTAFSAEGMLTCDVLHTAEISALAVSPVTEDAARQMTERFETLECRVLAQFADESIEPATVDVERTIGIKYRLQTHAVDIEVASGPLTVASLEGTVDRFTERYRQLYGQGSVLVDGAVEFEVHRVRGRCAIDSMPLRSPVAAADSPPEPTQERLACFEPSGFVPTSVFDGSSLLPGHVLMGPAIIERMGDSVVVPPGFEAIVDPYLTLRIGRSEGTRMVGATTTAEVGS